MEVATVRYFPDKDEMWNMENLYTIGFCQGLGLDVGSGDRTLKEDIITLDKHNLDANFIGDAQNLVQFKDKTFDYVYSSHILEHCLDIVGTIKEWARVVKLHGYIVLVYPDARFIPNKDHPQCDPQHKWDLQREDLREIIKCISCVEIVNKRAEAHENYSALFVLRRIK